MSLASAPIGQLPVAGQEQRAATTTKPPRRTTTARADVVSDPEPR